MIPKFLSKSQIKEFIVHLQITSFALELWYEKVAIEVSIYWNDEFGGRFELEGTLSEMVWKVWIGVDKRAVKRLTLSIENVGWFDSGVRRFRGSFGRARLHAVQSGFGTTG